MSDIQRDIERVEACIENHVDVIDARDEWDRLKPRLTPDRQKLAAAMDNAHGPMDWDYALALADAAIAAIGETP